MDQSGNGAMGSNRRRRSYSADHQIDQNNRPMNRRRTSITNSAGNGNGAAGEVQNGDDELFLSLSLSLGPVPPMTSSQPPPMVSSPFLVASSPVQPPPFMTSQLSSPLLTFFFPSPQPPEDDVFSPRNDCQSAFLPLPRDPVTNSAGKPLRNSTDSQLTAGERATVPPPYLWATNQRGRIHSLEYLESKQITAITGDVQCKQCEKIYQISYDLREKFTEVEKFVEENKESLRERAPATWMNPVAMRCELCGREKAVKPVMSERKRKINWLFLLLGKHLGYCTLEQLKYFCKHSNNHRTGAKDRVLYLTYLGLCKMLKPCELFDR
ncbi:PREDICTED: uncharacterized protein LOC104798812 [Tarenaya hassleriana]|uniref:uncharacterized protein LOC104798812 n=1 Tax=Tarenaya hassleriana TaxID=28532 RepID=UPI00053C10BE|nr:PREDICTED: uncharacterized protein LOC104798812 [Tarenaya hassleriana]